MDMKPVYIYGLVDPETNEIRYIGKTINPSQRLRSHINEKGSNCHRSNWIQSLRAKGLKPGMVCIEEIRGAWPWQESEKHWIAYARKNGWPITNNTAGGDGVSGLTEEARERVRNTWKGRKHKPDSISKIREASSQRRHGPETRKKMSDAHKGREIKWVDKVAASLRKISDEDVIAIKARLDSGELGKSLAEEFGVHRTTVSKIKMGKYYVK